MPARASGVFLYLSALVLVALGGVCCRRGAGKAGQGSASRAGSAVAASTAMRRFSTTVAKPGLRGLARLRYEREQTTALLASRPKSWFMLRKLARLHLALSDFTRLRAHDRAALRYARRAIAAKSPFAEHLWIELRALIRLGRLAEARGRLVALPKHLSASARGMRARARIALARRAYDVAKRYAARATEIAPKHGGSRLLRARVAMEAGDHAAALRLLRTMRGARLSARVARARAELAARMDKPGAVLGYSRYAMRLEPGHIRMLVLTAWGMQKMGGPRGARNAVRAALRLNPKVVLPANVRKYARAARMDAGRGTGSGAAKGSVTHTGTGTARRR